MKGLIPEPGPLRPLALATLLSRIGNGLLMTVSVLYFNRIVGLSIAQIGLGLTVAGLFGLLAGVPLGHLADRRGPRTLFVILSVTVASLSLLYLLVETFWQFLLVSTVITILDRGAGAVRGALIAAVTQGAGRVAARAYLRAVTNIGIMAGAGIATLALHFDTAAAYRSMFVVDTALTIGSAFVILAVPRVAPQPKTDDGPVWIALRDHGYLAVAALECRDVDPLRGAGRRHPALGGRPHRGAALDGRAAAGHQHGGGVAVPGQVQPGDRRSRQCRPRAPGRPDSCCWPGWPCSPPHPVAAWWSRLSCWR